MLRSVYHTELHCKEETVRTSISPLPGFGGQNCGENQMRPAYKQKNPTISNVKSLDLWSEWRESNSRPLEPHCASLENTMYNPILPRLSIVKFQMHYTILYARFSRSTAKISNRTERPCRFLMLYWPWTSLTVKSSRFKMICKRNSAQARSSNTAAMKSSSIRRSPRNRCKSSSCFRSNPVPVVIFFPTLAHQLSAYLSKIILP